MADLKESEKEQANGPKTVIIENGPPSLENGNDIEKGNGNKIFTGNGRGRKDDKATDDDGSTKSHGSSYYLQRFRSTSVITGFILILGGATAGAFLGLGISQARRVTREDFERSSSDLYNKLQNAWEDYVNAASLIHGRCRSRNITRKEFRNLYEYLTAGGLDFQAMQFDPNVTHEERPFVEQEARDYYAKYYPEISYRGIIGFETEQSKTLEPRSEAPYYFPIHFMEPIIGNVAAIDLDYHASGSRKRTVLSCMTTGQPALTDRLRLVQETEEIAYGVVLMHPGINISSYAMNKSPDLPTLHEALAKAQDGGDVTETDPSSLSAPPVPEPWPRDLASIVVRIPDLLRRTTENQGESSAVYIYDTTDPDGTPIFMGGVDVRPQPGTSKAQLTFLAELSLDELRASNGKKNKIKEQIIPAANKYWTVVVKAVDDTFEPNLLFVILGGVFIIVASICLGIWVYTNTYRMAKFNKMKATAEAEKAALILDNAKQSAKAERELNDFIAHEVRNPVAAAMSACSFVKTSVGKKELFTDEAEQESMKDDVYIIDNALNFVNDLLRNMLDMHRAANKHLKVNMAPTDVLHDVLEPVDAMLFQQRGNGKTRVVVECDDSLIVMTDRLRLKQIVLNLARNSCKFLEEGFIKLSAKVVDEQVQVSVEDSGPGIPLEKRERLFAKYQESLDMLSQGTGIGLSLCKNLVELMGGDIWLDTDYHSGLPGKPGARFVVDLRFPPMDENDVRASLEENGLYDNHDGTGNGTNHMNSSGNNAHDDNNGAHNEEMRAQGAAKYQHLDLPDELSVLFVDDDPILRKLFARTVRTVAPTWNMREAANGETALKLCEEENFDLIFIDMYMASVQKQLLGTETVQEMRSRGITSRICGLSANDKEAEFYEAGADAFTFKPFPCEKRALTADLCRILFATAEDTSAKA